MPTDMELLNAARIGVHALEPFASDSRMAAIVSGINVALSELYARYDRGGEALRLACDASSDLVQRCETLLGEADLPLPDPAAATRDGGAHPTMIPMTAHLDTIQARLCELACLLGGAISEGAGDGNWRRRAHETLIAIARLECDRAIDGGQSPPPPATRARIAIDADTLKRHFADSGIAAGPLTFINEQLLSGGFSRETMKIAMCDAAGREACYIVRRQLEGDGLLGNACLSLAQELPFLRLAHAAGLPVARVLSREPDTSLPGAPFIVMEMMNGVTLGTPLGATTRIDREILHQLAISLAKLHTIDWSVDADALCRASGVHDSPEPTPERLARSMFDAFEGYWRGAGLGPLPLLDLTLDWLRRYVPSTARRVAICHGDIGFHNLMGLDGKLTALLDWETARLADPAKDMAMARETVSPHVPWDTFMAWYVESGGPRIDDASLDFYSVWNCFSHLLVCEVARGARLGRTDHPEIGYVHLGYPIRRHFATQFLAQVVPIWKACATTA